MRSVTETQNHISSGSDEELITGLDTDFPAMVNIDAGKWLYLSGWCFHKVEKIRKIKLVVGNSTHDVIAHSIFRPDILRQYPSHQDHSDNSCYSGFWALIPVFSNQAKGSAVVQLHALLKSGKKLSVELCTIDLYTVSSPDNSQIKLEPSVTDTPLVAICLATYNPPLRLFRKQIASIVNQTHQNWICVISDDASIPELQNEVENIVRDDPRFIYSASPKRLGFYYNFERALSMVPECADYVALSDQDDYWYPDKLETLLSNFDEATTLVYSDMKIVDEHGQELSNTYWTTRRNNYTNLGSLLLANTITGAASMFPRDLLSYILPFPTRVGQLYHDHWIACLALVLGRIKYVGDPLYDYVQHSANVIGHAALPRESLYKVIYYIFANLRTKEGRKFARQVYFDHVVRIMLIARNAILRCRRSATKRKLRTLERLAYLDNSLMSCAWLALRGIKDWNRISVTIGAEYHLLLGVAWKIYIILVSRLGLATRYDMD
jgi:glycosyltransferase involved in cell wall biosynthesis